MRHFLWAGLILGAATLDAGILTLNGTSPINAVEGSAFNGTIATINDSNTAELASSLSGMIDWGDATNSAATFTSLGSGVFGVMGTHIYTEAGTYVGSLSVNDGHGDTLTATLADADVLDAPLSISSGPFSFDFTPGTLLSNLVLLNFSDANLFGLESDFTATINWGDGTPSSFGTVTSLGGGVYDLIGSHTYTVPGAFTVDLTVNDQGGSTLTAKTSGASVSSTPEPGSIGLMCAGLVIVGWMRIRRV